MDAKRFMYVSLDLWNGRKFRSLRLLRPDEDEMETTGLFLRFMALLYDYNGVMDWNDPMTRAVTAQALGIGEDECGALVEDLVRIEFVSRELWDAPGPDGRPLRHVSSEGVDDQIAYRLKRSEAGKASGNARRNRRNG